MLGSEAPSVLPSLAGANDAAEPSHPVTDLRLGLAALGAPPWPVTGCGGAPQPSATPGASAASATTSGGPPAAFGLAASEEALEPAPEATPLPSGLAPIVEPFHAGVKYNRWVIDNFYTDTAIPKQDRMLFAFASYNAGPGRVAGLRRQAKAQGLDPDRWFNNVELVAAKQIGRETVTYVANIYKYYLAYQLLLRSHEVREQARQAVQAKRP
jgi:hypothetical protein